MTTTAAPPNRLRRFTSVSMLFGALLVVLGILAVASPIFTSVATTLALGVVLVLAGAGGLVAAIRDRGMRKRTWAALWALSALLLGLALIYWPLKAAMSIALVMSAFFVARGLFAVGLAFSDRSARGGWWLVAIGGAVTVALGLFILIAWPAAAVALLGALVGLDLIVYGLALILGSYLIGR